MMKWLVNPMVRFVLRGPLHRQLPGVMLLTVTGRRSGRRYTTPVQYVSDRNSIYVLTHDGRTWWRNARDGAPVAYRLAGEKRQGTASNYRVGSEGAAPAIIAFDETTLERGLARFGDGAVIVVITPDRSTD